MHKDKKKIGADKPYFLFAKLVFEFFNNDDIDFKHNSIRRICKELRKDFNVSVTGIQDSYLDDPERGVLVLAIAESSEDLANKGKEQILTYLDSNMPARLISEEWAQEEVEWIWIRNKQ